MLLRLLGKDQKLKGKRKERKTQQGNTDFQQFMETPQN